MRKQVGSKQTGIECGFLFLTAPLYQDTVKQIVPFLKSITFSIFQTRKFS